MSNNHFTMELEKLKIDENYIVKICKDLKTNISEVTEEVYHEAMQFVKENQMMSCAYPWLLYSKGWFYFDRTRFNESTENFDQAFGIFTAENNIDGQLATISAFVSSYSAQNKHAVAIRIGAIGMDLAKRHNNYERLMQIKNNIAALYMELDEHKKAKSLLDQIENTPGVLDNIARGVCYINQAECCSYLGDLDEALDYITRAYELAKVYSSKPIPNILKEMGHIYALMGNYKLAEEKYIESIQLSQKTDQKLYMQDTLIYWSELDLLQAQYEKAIVKLKQMEAEILKSKSIRNLNKTYLNLSKAYKGKEDYKSAYEYMVKYSEIEREMDQIKRNSSMALLDETNEDEEKTIYRLLYEQSETLYSIGQKIIANLNKKNLFNVVAAELKNLINADIIQIVSFDERRKQYQKEYCLEKGKELVFEDKTIPEGGLFDYCIQNKHEIFIRNIEDEYNLYVKDFESYKNRLKSLKELEGKEFPQSMMFVPLIGNSSVLGVVSVQSFDKNAYTHKDLNVFKTLVNYLAIGIENANLYEQVEYSSKYDSLTGILNRRELFARTAAVYMDPARAFMPQKDKERNVGAFMIDIDHFKSINDRYTHREGDKVLIEVVNTIKANADKDDILGRYGGEEFLLVSFGQTDEACKQKAEKIRKAIENLPIYTCEENEIKVTVSIGVANLDAKGHDIEEMIWHADKELYKAKNAGRNKTSIITPERILKSAK